MSSGPYFLTASFSKRFNITIPAAAATALTLESIITTLLAGAALGNGTAEVVGFEISGLDTANASRAAIRVGDTAATCIQYVGAGLPYYSCAKNEFQKLFIEAAVAEITTAVVILHFA